jgi:hypothetical protein
VAAVIQLCVFHQETSSARVDDYALGYWLSTVGNQVVQCLAIVTTTLPYAKIFMESFESGLIRVDNVGRKEAQSTDGSGRAYELLDISRGAQQRGISTTKTYTVESAPTSQL